MSFEGLFGGQSSGVKTQTSKSGRSFEGLFDIQKSEPTSPSAGGVAEAPVSQFSLSNRPEPKVVTFPEFLGGGQVNRGPITTESKEEARNISDSQKDEIRGGSYQETLKEVNHIVNVAAGGTKEGVNLNGLGTNLSFTQGFQRVFGKEFRPSDFSDEQRQEGRVSIEKKLDKDVKSGLITNDERIVKLKGWDFIREGKPTKTDIAKETASEFGGLVKDFFTEAVGPVGGGLFGSLFRVGAQTTNALSIVTNMATLAIAKEGDLAMKSTGQPSTFGLEDVSYDKLWADELDSYADRAVTIGAPLDPILNLFTGKKEEPKSIFKEQYADYATKANKADAEDDVPEFLKNTGKMAFIKFSEEWSNPFFLFNIKGVRSGSFKLAPEEQVLFKQQLNPIKRDFLLGSKIKVKPKSAVYKIEVKPTKAYVEITKKGKGKVVKTKEPDVKLHLKQNKNGTVDVKVTNSGGELLNKSIIKTAIEEQGLLGAGVKAPAKPAGSTIPQIRATLKTKPTSLSKVIAEENAIFSPIKQKNELRQNIDSKIETASTQANIENLPLDRSSLKFEGINSKNFTDVVENYVKKNIGKLEKLYTDATGKVDEVVKIIESLPENIQAVVDIKRPTSVINKIIRKRDEGRSDYGVEDIGDFVRSSVIYSDMPSLEKALDDLIKRTPGGKLHIEDFFENPTNLGFEAVNIDIKLKDGSMLEMQFHTEESWRVKKELHDIYEVARPFGKNIPQELTAESLKIVENSKTKFKIASEALALTKEQGGVTISLDGKQPKEGFSLALSKKTELEVPKKDINSGDIYEYIDKHFEELKKPGNYFGAWEDGDNIVMDVSTVFGNKAQAVKAAQKSEQKAIYDLKNDEEIKKESYEEIIRAVQSKTKRDKGAVPATSSKGPAKEKSNKGREVDSTPKPLIKDKFSTHYEKIKSELGLTGDGIKIDTQVNKEVAKKAYDYVQRNPEKATRVAYGLEEAPSSQSAVAIAISIKEALRSAGKFQQADALDKIVSKKFTSVAQELNLAKLDLSNIGKRPITSMITAKRLEKIGNKIGEPKAKEAKAVAKKKIKKQASELKDQVIKSEGKTAENNLKALDDIINSIIC